MGVPVLPFPGVVLTQAQALQQQQQAQALQQQQQAQALQQQQQHHTG
jgi:hypothetical protein